jgi:hypothetical protein
MRTLLGLISLALLSSACASLAAAEVGPVPDITAVPTETMVSVVDEIDPDAARNKRVDDDREFRLGGILPLDAIPPVYEPEFVSASESPLEPDELIIGVAWNGEAKAYPISVLRIREIVNDELAGIPTLVTW